jgi:hypothetical protein
MSLSFPISSNIVHVKKGDIVSLNTSEVITSPEDVEKCIKNITLDTSISFYLYSSSECSISLKQSRIDSYLNETLFHSGFVSSLPSSLPTFSLPTSSLPTSSLPTSSLPTSSLPTSSLSSVPTSTYEISFTDNSQLSYLGSIQAGFIYPIEPKYRSYFDYFYSLLGLNKLFAPVTISHILSNVTVLRGESDIQLGLSGSNKNTNDLIMYDYETY